jgi:cell division septation protein DedD
MRDESHFDYEADAEAQPRRGRWAVALGGVMALSLLAGLVVWSYRLGVRDPNDVPVIRAAAGSHKTRPEDPGGATFDHQGRGVYAAMSGGASGVSEITLAPPPERLADEDAPNAELTAAQEVAEIGPVLEGASELDLLVASVLEDQPAAPASESGADPAPVAALVEPTALAPLSAPLAPPRPSLRVAPAETAAAAAVPAALQTPAPAPVPTAAAVQLGAYLTEEVAMQMWGDLQRRYGDVLKGRSPAVAPIERDGRTLFGLRAVAFADAAEARAMCAALRSRGGDCFVTLPR